MLDEIPNNTRQSEDGLIVNITRFSNLLRDNGISVALPSVLDILQGLALIDISSLSAFHCLLQVNLVCRREDIAKFDKLFYAYWLPQNRSHMNIPADDQEEEKGEEKDSAASKADKITEFEPPDNGPPGMLQKWSLRYSPDPQPGRAENEEIRFTESRTFYEYINKLLQPLKNRLSRRYQYTIRGREISLRRILRKNMQFGGELIFLDFKRKKIKNRRVIYFCDVSGSMDIYTLMTLQFIHALKQVNHRTEVFFFSTDLSRKTDQFALSDFSAALSGLPDSVSGWGGGTRIGHCLRLFNKSYSQRVLSSKDIVMILSDGWDRGEIDLLQSQMALLKRKSYKMIWLNPLIGTRDYQPICQGMAAALPYVDYFLPLADLQDLRYLSRTLEKIMV
jgi:uncharacterized protein with von Willebrand factor type A (vWA) domain